MTLPSKKVISPLELLPHVIASPVCSVIPAVTAIQLFVPALSMETLPVETENTVTEEAEVISTVVTGAVGDAGEVGADVDVGAGFTDVAAGCVNVVGWEEVTGGDVLTGGVVLEVQPEAPEKIKKNRIDKERKLIATGLNSLIYHNCKSHNQAARISAICLCR